MFFDDPVAAFTNVNRAMRPGARLAVLSWAPMTEQQWLIVTAAAALEHLPLPDFGEAAGPGMFGLEAHITEHGVELDGVSLMTTALASGRPS
jgi:hypothetical protein